MTPRRPLRIALLHPRAGDLGGVERKAHEIARAALEAGHEVHYFCERAAPGVDPRIQLHRLPNPFRPVRALKVGYFDRASQAAIARAGPFDVVHGFGKTSRQDVYSDGSGCLADFQSWSVDELPSAWRRAVRRHGLHQRVVARIERERFTRGHYRRILAISKRVRDQIVARHGVPPEDVELHYPGVSLERFHPLPADARAAVRAELGLPIGAPLLVFLGSEYRRKGLSTALAALRELAEAQLLVIGRAEPRDQAWHRALAARLGVGDRCHFLGLRRDPERHLAAADCLVFPTRFDAFGRVVLEAMACGTPVVASARSGAAELVVEGKTGSVLADPGDAAELAWRTGAFLDPGRREEVGRRARHEALAYPWERHVARVLEVYEELSDRPA